MNVAFLFFLSLVDDLNFFPKETSLPLPPEFLIIGIILIIATIVIIFFLKKIIINSILGLIVWALAVFVFKVSLPLIPSLAVGIIFGPAGIGVMMALKVFGLLA